jgi:hypothetical protein
MEGVAWSPQRIPTAVKFGFLDQSRYFSIQVAFQLQKEKIELASGVQDLTAKRH